MIPTLRKITTTLSCALALAGAAARPSAADRHLMPAYTRRHGEVDEKLLLARALIGEGGWLLRNDHPAILRVLQRRRTLPTWRREPLSELVVHYCHAVDPRVTRTSLNREAVNAMTWDDVPGPIQRLVERFLAGEHVVDPCEEPAWHWGSHEDTAGHPPTRFVECGRTSNRFLRQPRRRVELIDAVVGGTIPANVARGTR